jgi:hypothetical protein
MIRLQFVAQRSVSTAVIQFLSHGWCSHVDTILDDGGLLGARLNGGVSIQPPDYEVWSRKVIVDLPCSLKIEVAYYSFVMSQVGKPYDVTADIAFALNRNWREEDSWMCSELVSFGLERSKFFPYQLAAPTSGISPASLFLTLSAIVPVA